MITIEHLSENYNSVKGAVAEMLGEHYTGVLENYDHTPYGIDTVLVYQDNALLDIKVFDPFGKLQTGLYTNHDGWTDWLCSYCSNQELMIEGELSKNEIKQISELC